MESLKYRINNLHFLYRFARLSYPFRSVIKVLAHYIYKFRRIKLILVFGHSRSGTTMLGEFIAFGNESKYIHEPVKQVLRHHFDRIDQQEEFWKYANSPELSNFKTHLLLCIVLFYGIKAKRINKVICIKEVSMVNKIIEAHTCLGFAQFIFITRHPCGNIDSLIRQPSRKESNDQPFSIHQIENISTNWAKRIGKTQEHFSNNNLDIKWLTFETLTKSPVEEFQKLYVELGLLWTNDINCRIKELTTGEDGDYYDIKRDSKSQADKWKDSLKKDQIEAIRHGCQKFPTNIYEGF